VGRARTSGGPLTSDERLAKIVAKEQAVRKLWDEHGELAKSTKAAKEKAEEAELELKAEIRDDPEGELEYRDEERG